MEQFVCLQAQRKKSEVRGAFIYNGFHRNISDPFYIDLPMVKWEDDEPWLIEDLKKLEVVEEYEQRNTFQRETYLDYSFPEDVTRVCVTFESMKWCLVQKGMIPDPFETGDGKSWEVIGNVFDNPELIGDERWQKQIKNTHGECRE